MIAFVTGASAGFGAAICRRLVREGHRVVATARRAEKLAGLHAELGEQLLPLALDVRDRAAVDRAVKALPAAFAEVDVLVNNAGLAVGLEPAQQGDADAWAQMVETNINGVLHCTHALLPGMVALAMSVGTGAPIIPPKLTPGGAPMLDAAGHQVLDFDLSRGS